MAYLFTAVRQGPDSYSAHYGYVSYSVTETATAVTVTLNSVGERMTVSNSSYSSYYYYGASTVTATLDSDKTITATNSDTRRCTSQDTYYNFGGTAVSKTFNKGTSATTKSLSITWTWYGATRTGSTTISIPALASYAVSYNANGGSNAPSAQTKYYGVTLALNSDTTKPTAPSGFTFQGWGTSKTDTSVDYARGANYTANAAITLYAIWKKNITVSYALNGGSNGPSNETKSVYANADNTNPSAVFTIPSTVPTRTNYRFTGWSDGTNIYQPSAQLTLTASKALTAQWTQDYIAPKFTNVQVYRTDSGGTANNGTGTYGKLIVSWNKATLAGTAQTTTFTAKYREHTSTGAYTTITTSTGSSVDTTFGGGNIASGSQYDVVLTLEVSGHDTVTYTTFISTEACTMDFNANGTGVGLLQVVPDGGTGIYLGGPVKTQIKTSFKESIAMGSYGSAQSTVNDLVNEVRFSSGCSGSASIGTAYTKNNVTINTGWYNYLWIPHRSGGVNGEASGDNCNYGNLLLFGMNNTNGRFIVRVSSANIQEVVKLHTSIETDAIITNQSTYADSNGLWTYRKWSNGFQEVWYYGSIVFSSATSSVGGWNRAIQNVTIPTSNMTGISAFSDNTSVTVTGAYSGAIYTCGGIKTSGTQFEAQVLSVNSIAARTYTQWSVYIAGYAR